MSDPFLPLKLPSFSIVSCFLYIHLNNNNKQFHSCAGAVLMCFNNFGCIHIFAYDYDFKCHSHHLSCEMVQKDVVFFSVSDFQLLLACSSWLWITSLYRSNPQTEGKQQRERERETESILQAVVFTCLSLLIFAAFPLQGFPQQALQ